MKAPVSISVVSSLFVAIFAALGTASGETNDLVRAKASPSDVSLSRSALQILQLTQAGMDESVITSFISNSGIFQLSADQIVYLNDLGVSSGVIQVMLAHDREKLAASSQNTNASNPRVALQAETATVAEILTSQRLGQTNVQAAVAVNPGPSAKTDNFSKEDLIIVQRLPQPQPVPVKKKVFYPVRAPYPVELTAPIVFLDAPTF